MKIIVRNCVLHCDEPRLTIRGKNMTEEQWDVMRSALHSVIKLQGANPAAVECPRKSAAGTLGNILRYGNYTAEQKNVLKSAFRTEDFSSLPSEEIKPAIIAWVNRILMGGEGSASGDSHEVQKKSVIVTAQAVGMAGSVETTQASLASTAVMPQKDVGCESYSRKAASEKTAQAAETKEVCENADSVFSDNFQKNDIYINTLKKSLVYTSIQEETKEEENNEKESTRTVVNNNTPQKNKNSSLQKTKNVTKAPQLISIKEHLQKLEEVDKKIAALRETQKVRQETLKFTKPTLEQVEEYCRERGNNINPVAFINFYESKGWYVGKNKMKSWQAAVRSWEVNSNNSNNNYKNNEQNVPQYIKDYHALNATRTVKEERPKPMSLADLPDFGYSAELMAEIRQELIDAGIQ